MKKEIKKREARKLQAYNEGVKAGLDINKEQADNPYRLGSVSFTAWNSGYEHGLNEWFNTYLISFAP